MKGKIFRTVATFLAACGVSTCFTACYGMPVNPNDQFADFKFKVEGDIDDNGTTEPVRGIRVTSCDTSESVVTDQDGIAVLNIPSWTDVEFKDVDGENNGTFKTQTISVRSYTGDDINVVLEPGTDDAE